MNLETKDLDDATRADLPGQFVRLPDGGIVADANREQAVREATGEAARFNQIYAEYSRAPGVTRERLYLETMQRVLAKSNKVVIDSKGASAPIILPPDVFRPRAAAQAPSAAPAIQPQARSASDTRASQ